MYFKSERFLNFQHSEGRGSLLRVVWDGLARRRAIDFATIGLFKWWGGGEGGTAERLACAHLVLEAGVAGSGGTSALGE